MHVEIRPHLHWPKVEIIIGQPFSFSGGILFREKHDNEEDTLSYVYENSGCPPYPRLAILARTESLKWDVKIYQQDIAERIKQQCNAKNWLAVVLAEAVSILQSEGLLCEVLLLTKQVNYHYGFKDGQNDKAKEIRNVLGIRE